MNNLTNGSAALDFAVLQAQSFEGAAWTTVGVSFLELLGLTLQIGLLERHDNRNRWRTIVRPVNILLVSMILSNCASCMGFYYYCILYDPIGFTVAYAVFICFESTFQSLTMFYSWNRGKPIVELVFPIIVPSVWVFLSFSVLLFVALDAINVYAIILGNGYALPATDPVWISANVLSILTSTFAIAFDVLTLGCYIKYLRNLTEEKQDFEIQRLHIISMYGIIASLWNLASFGITIATYWSSSWPDAVYLAMTELTVLMPLVYLFIQLAMKYALVCERRREDERRHDIRERARQPLLMGLLVPVATMLNIQALSVPLGLASGARGEAAATALLGGHRAEGVLSTAALLFGVVATAADFVRMLEKKIKWSTRLVIGGSLVQALLNTAVLVAALAAWLRASWPSPAAHAPYSHSLVFTVASAITSLSASYLGYALLKRNQDQLYVYTLSSLSAHQRQLVILTILSFAYIVLSGAIYANLEVWDFNEAMYFVVVVFTTIGFGDLFPKSVLGKALLPLFASLGIGMVGLNIFSVRQVLLEMFTLELAATFSKRFGMLQEHHDSSSDEDARSEVSRRVDGPPLAIYQDIPIASPIPSRHPSIIGSATPLNSDYSASVPSNFLSHLHLASSPTAMEAPGSASAASSPIHHSGSLTQTTQTRPLLHTSTSFNFDSPNTTRVPTRSLTLGRRGNTTFPRLTLLSNTRIRRHTVVRATKETFRHEISRAGALVLATMLLFGLLFALLEEWHPADGIYFTFITLTTIGFGDLSPRLPITRSIFIWFVFVGVAGVTYLGSMVSERVLNQWTLTVGAIENRMGRYEVKARLKRQFCGGHGGASHPGSAEGSAGPSSPAGTRRSVDHEHRECRETGHIGSGGGRVVRIISPRNQRISGSPGGTRLLPRRSLTFVGTERTSYSDEDHFLLSDSEDEGDDLGDEAQAVVYEVSSLLEANAMHASPSREESRSPAPRLSASSSVRIFSARARSTGSHTGNSFSRESDSLL
ncbi:hypothetical protein BC830DRAFT_1172801 [Chytriomyces sp. MP71]|nr:hypothetical protein BC830DRAFT_1172801 [Chytriomyces sp. MP71]